MGTGLFSIGIRALQANQAALQTVGANISNANTEGYSRQSVQLTTAGGQYTGTGYMPKGVKIDTVTRSHDDFITREAQLTTALAAADQTRADQLTQLEKALPMGEQGLGYAATQFLNAFVDVSSHPQDAASRQTVLARAEDLAAQMRSSGERIETLQQGVSSDLENSVSMINSLAQQVAELNQQIAQQKGSGHDPNDLLDQRDLAVQKINGYLQVSTIEADDGSLGLFIGGGQRLVLGNEALKLSVAHDSFDPSRSAVQITDSGMTRTLADNNLVGGSVAGLMRFQNDDLANARNRIGQLAAALSASVNRQQSLGLTLNNTPVSGPPIFETSTARVLPATTNARDGSGAFASNVSITVADATQLQASEYSLRADAANPGRYELTRLADGLVRNVADGDTIDGFTLGVGAPPPAAGDRFLLQPVSSAAVNLKAVLKDPLGVAAAAPLSASPATTNTGSASVARLAVVDPAYGRTLSASVTFSDDSGNYDWDLRDAGGAIVSLGSGTWQAGEPISINGFELSLAGRPLNGDRFDIVPTPHPAANNGNALEMLALRDFDMVGRVDTGDAKLQPGRTVTDAYAQTLADIGVRVQTAQAASTMSAAVAKDARDNLQAKSGVNLDEEAARLIQFQQSYQAAAKVLQVAQNVFETLLQTAAP